MGWIAPWQNSIETILQGRSNNFRMLVWSKQIVAVMMYGELVAKQPCKVSFKLGLNIEQSQELNNVRIRRLDD